MSSQGLLFLLNPAQIPGLFYLILDVVKEGILMAEFCVLVRIPLEKTMANGFRVS